MKPLVQHKVRQWLVAGSLALALPFSVLAAPEGPGAPEACPMMGGPGVAGHQGAPMGREHGRFQGGPMMGGGEMGLPFMHELKLSEAQEDKIFNIMHTQAPLMREKGKALHKAEEGLRGLAQSGDYSEAKAKSLTDTMGKAIAEMTLLRVKAERQVYEVLTPEQRKQIDEMKNRAEQPPKGGPGEGRNVPPPRN